MKLKFVTLEIRALAAWRGPVTGTKFPLTKSAWDMMVRVEESPKPTAR